MEDKNIVIIGGGPAGIMAAITAARDNKNVILIESNSEIGKKLRITGGGRCNLTNATDPIGIINNTIKNQKFLYSALYSFTSGDLIKLMESNGCPLKVEAAGKVFPSSDRSSDIIECFKQIMNDLKVKIYYDCHITDIIISHNRVKAVKTSQKQVINCGSIVLATGGISYPHTGSTGGGHYMAERLGHKITDLKPSLVSMNIKEKWLSNMMGISFDNILIKTKINKKPMSFHGDLLFTHYGMSGPVILELSAYLNKHDFSQPHAIYIDLLAELDQESLREILVSDNNLDLSIQNLLSAYMPRRFVIGLLEELNIAQDTILHQLKKLDRNKLIESIKRFHINITSLRDIKSAIVTSGGIATNEIDPSTMESKKIKGLFFAGEIIDVDALTGGYNLQIAFSTGYLAGLNA